MARWTEPKAEQVEAWRAWVAERPPLVRVVAERFEPWSVYRMRSTGQRVSVLGFDEDDGGSVTLRVAVRGDWNLVTHERDVFGIDPGDLEPCDLPAPGELVGSLDLPVEFIKEAVFLGRERDKGRSR